MPAIIISALVAVVMISIIYLVRFGRRLRHLVIDGLSASEFRRIDLSEFPHANIESLAENTSKLEILGFSQIADFTIVRSKPCPMSVCSRLLFNRGMKCSATIVQHFDNLRCYLHSVIILSSTIENNWSVGTHNAPPNPIAPLIRHPRVIGRRLPGIAISEMLSAHMKMTEDVSNGLELRIVSPTSFDEHIRDLTLQATERRELAVRKNAFCFGVAYYWGKMFSDDDWMGDYPKEAKRLKAPPSA